MSSPSSSIQAPVLYVGPLGEQVRIWSVLAHPLIDTLYPAFRDSMRKDRRFVIGWWSFTVAPFVRPLKESLRSWLLE